MSNTPLRRHCKHSQADRREKWSRVHRLGDFGLFQRETRPAPAGHAGRGQSQHTTRLYLAISDRDHPVASATFNPTVPPSQNIWQFVIEAIAAALHAKPPPQSAAKANPKPRPST